MPRHAEVTRAQLLELLGQFGVAPATLKDWVRDGCPHRVVNRRTLFNPESVWRWRLKRAEESGKRAIDSDDPKTRKLQAEARKAELDVLLAEGTMVLAEDVEREMARLMQTLNTALNALPGALAARLGSCASTAERLAMLQAWAEERKAELRAVAGDAVSADDEAPDGAGAEAAA